MVVHKAILRINGRSNSVNKIIFDLLRYYQDSKSHSSVQDIGDNQYKFYLSVDGKESLDDYIKIKKFGRKIEKIEETEYKSPNIS